MCIRDRTAVIPNAAGCDSTITINLTVESIDKSVTLNGSCITANTAGAIYQWVDCDDNYLPISDENKQEFTAKDNGNYAVVLSVNGCVDTSSCSRISILEIIENSLKCNFTLYPNPSVGIVNIDLGAEVENISLIITNIQGRVVMNKIVQKGKILSFNLNEPSGIYLVTIKVADEQVVFRLVRN